MSTRKRLLPPTTHLLTTHSYFSQMPRGTHLVGQQLGSFRVADDLLFDCVPFQRPADHRGDVTQVSRRLRTVGDLDRGERLLPGLYTIQELPLMSRRDRQENLQIFLLFARFDFRNPLLIRGVEASLFRRLPLLVPSIDPDPAILADPFCAALDVSITAGDDQLDILGIFA